MEPPSVRAQPQAPPRKKKMAAPDTHTPVPAVRKPPPVVPYSQHKMADSSPPQPDQGQSPGLPSSTGPGGDCPSPPKPPRRVRTTPLDPVSQQRSEGKPPHSSPLVRSDDPSIPAATDKTAAPPIASKPRSKPPPPSHKPPSVSSAAVAGGQQLLDHSSPPSSRRAAPSSSAGEVVGGRPSKPPPCPPPRYVKRKQQLSPPPHSPTTPSTTAGDAARQLGTVENGCLQDPEVAMATSLHTALLDSKTHPLDQETRPLDQETRPLDQETRPPDQETRPPDLETCPPDLETRPPDLETRPPDETDAPACGSSSKGSGPVQPSGRDDPVRGRSQKPLPPSRKLKPLLSAEVQTKGSISSDSTGTTSDGCSGKMADQRENHFAGSHSSDQCSPSSGGNSSVAASRSESTNNRSESTNNRSESGHSISGSLDNRSDEVFVATGEPESSGVVSKSESDNSFNTSDNSFNTSDNSFNTSDNSFNRSEQRKSSSDNNADSSQMIGSGGVSRGTEGPPVRTTPSGSGATIKPRRKAPPPPVKKTGSHDNKRRASDSTVPLHTSDLNSAAPPLAPPTQHPNHVRKYPARAPVASSPSRDSPLGRSRDSPLGRCNSLPRRKLNGASEPSRSWGSRSATLKRKLAAPPTDAGEIPEGEGTPRTRKNVFRWIANLRSTKPKDKKETTEKGNPPTEAPDDPPGDYTEMEIPAPSQRPTHVSEAPPTFSSGYAEMELPAAGSPRSHTLPHLFSRGSPDNLDYAAIDFPEEPSSGREADPPPPSPPPPSTDVYATVDLARKAKNRAVFKARSGERGQEPGGRGPQEGEGQAVVSRSLLKKNSALRSSRTLSADSFNIDDFLVMEKLREEEDRTPGREKEEETRLGSEAEQSPVYAAVQRPSRSSDPVSSSGGVADLVSSSGGVADLVSSSGGVAEHDSPPSPAHSSPPHLSPATSPPSLSPLPSPPTGRRAPPPVPRPYSQHKQTKTFADKSATLPARSSATNRKSGNKPRPLDTPTTKPSTARTLPRQLESPKMADKSASSRLPVSPAHTPRVEVTTPERKSAQETFSAAGQPTIYLRGTLVDLAKPRPQLLPQPSQDDDDDDYDTDWESDDDEEEEEEGEGEGEREADQGDEEEDEELLRSRPKTYRLAREIMTTERTFVRRLGLLDVHFRGAIEEYNRSHDRSHDRQVTEEVVRQILSNVGSLRLLNTDFLQQLEQRFRDWDSCPKIGDIMFKFGPYLRMYSEYISNFETGMKVLDDTQKRLPSFAHAVKEFEALPQCANLSVANYMLETVQRIPRYKLLLQDYIKHLPADSDDLKQSKLALDCIAKVAQQVNESIRHVDNFKKLLEIEKKLIGDTKGLITPTRKLLREGEVTKFSRKERTPRMLFLFNDILIYASTAQPPSFTSYKVIRRIPLVEMKLEDLDDPDVRHGFLIISTTKSFRLEASSEEEKSKWMKLGLEAIQAVQEQERSRYKIRSRQLSVLSERVDVEDARLGEFAPPWLPDSCVSLCMKCTCSFTVTRRRHHCRACGNIFCADCSRFSAALKYCGNKFGRICQSCHSTFKAKGVRVRIEKASIKKSSSSSTNLAQVLQEVKGRDQSSTMSGYLQLKSGWGWKRRWFALQNLALYAFGKHEDRAAKKSIIIPSHALLYPYEEDPLQFCLKHPGTGTLIFKGEDEDSVKRWVDALNMAVKGEQGPS